MLHVAGHDIHAVTHGAGALAVMIHCMLARHEALLPLAEAIGGRARLIDMPGHGRSGPWDGKTDFQQVVTEAAAACCDGPTHLIGHSFGATAALRLAVTRPDLVSRLTLFEPVYFAAAKGTPEHAEHQRKFRPFVTAMLAGDEERAAEIFNDLWGITRWLDIPPGKRKRLAARIHLIVAGAQAIEEDPEGITSPATLAKVACPVTLIRGAETEPVIGAVHAALADRLPNAKDHVIAGAGHMVPVTHVPEVTAIIRSAGQ